MNKFYKKSKRNEFKLLINYLFFAGIATIVDLGLLFILTSLIGIYYLVSATVSYTCGMLTNYILNKVYTFKNKSKKIGHQFTLFVFVALIGLGINLVLIWFLVEFIGLWYFFAKLIGVVVVTAWSFYGHKKLTFGLLK